MHRSGASTLTRFPLLQRELPQDGNPGPQCPSLSLKGNLLCIPTAHSPLHSQHDISQPHWPLILTTSGLSFLLTSEPQVCDQPQAGPSAPWSPLQPRCPLGSSWHIPWRCISLPGCWSVKHSSSLLPQDLCTCSFFLLGLVAHPLCFSQVLLRNHLHQDPFPGDSL